MKLSIITVSRNSALTIKNTIDSVLEQTYPYIEYIIIDGDSTDGTVEIVRDYKDKIDVFISEPDKGLYDAMNKGIQLASGDVVGMLNSDDFYIDKFVIDKVVKEFYKKQTDSIYADLVYVQTDNLEKIVRYYDSSYFAPEKLAYGWMPAHPTFFVKKDMYSTYGLYKINYKIAADYEMFARLLGKNKISYSYIKEPIVKMRMGGVSTSGFKSSYILNVESIRACKENGIYTNWFMILLKYPRKILGFFKKYE